MDLNDTQKAFDSLWSITDEIFKYVADIRTILDDSNYPVGEILPSDLPSSENSLPEDFIELLRQKVTCLENLDEKRKTLLGEFNAAKKSDDLNKMKQIRKEPGECASTDLRENALKSLLSYTRSRHAALATNLDLLEQASEELTKFCDELRLPNNEISESNYGCSQDSKQVFKDAIIMSERSNSQLHMERAALLREGAMLVETMLKVPQEINEETSKVLKDVYDSHLKIKNACLSTFGNLISPILDDFLASTQRCSMREMVNSVIINMRRSFHEYARLVQPYRQALESLAVHLDI